MNNLIEIKREVANLQQQMRQHGELLNHLLKQRGNQEAKLECMRQLKMEHIGNSEEYLQHAKALYGWLTGRDDELENTKATLNAVQGQLQKTKQALADAEAKIKALEPEKEGGKDSADQPELHAAEDDAKAGNGSTPANAEGPAEAAPEKGAVKDGENPGPVQ